MTVSLCNLVKRFSDGTVAVKGINLDVAQGEFLTLLGPSGCGKTTTLRLIAGLEDPDEARFGSMAKMLRRLTRATAMSRWCSSPTRYTLI